MKLTTLFTAACVASATLLGAAEIKIEKPNVRQTISDFIEIDNTKSYTLTFNAKGNSGNVNVWLYQFDAKKRQMGPYTVNCAPGSVTETVGPLIRGAKSFVVKDASKWVSPKWGAYIFSVNAKEDNSDMPNFTYDYAIKSITKQDDGTWKIEMANPLRISSPDKTLVRQQYDGDHMGWSQWGGKLPMAAPFTKTIAPVKGPGSTTANWWIGAKYVKVVALTNSKEPVTVDFTLAEAK